ncbi:MAG: TonB-dependent receptor [Sphingomonadaceae bacterium]
MRRFLLLAGIACVPWSVAIAADAEEGTIIVTGRIDGYATIETTTGTKTATPIVDVPQAIAVVTERQIGDQAIRSIADLVRLIPGVSSGQGEGHRDQVTLRGNNTTADFFVDGLRDDVQYFRSFYNVDRVEVHKGPNAMIFGRGGGGGVINRISKGVLLDKQVYGATASLDSFGSAYLAGDVNVAGADAGLRVNGFYERLDNHRDAYSGDRFGINPVAGATFADGGRVQLGYEYVDDRRVVDRGLPSARAGTISDPAGPLDDPDFHQSFFGDAAVNRTGFTGHTVSFRNEFAIDARTKLFTQALWGTYDKGYTNLFPAGPVDRATTTPTVAIEAYRDTFKRDTLIGQTNIEARRDLLGMEHVILIGAEFTDQSTGTERINGFFATPLSSANRRRSITLATTPVLPPVTFVAGPTANSNRAADTQLQQASGYIQDQIGVTPWLDVIAGLRVDRFNLAAQNQFTGQRFNRVDTLWSPRAAIVVKPLDAASIYVSYTKSYLPQSGDQFASLDASLATLAPERFENYELGAKWQLRPGLLFTAALYRLDRTNTRAAGPVAGTVVLTGAQRSEGFEASLTGRVTDQWQVALGYAYTDARIIATTTAAPVGRKVAQVPEHQLSLWSRYDLTPKFGFGVGLYHQARQFASISNAVVLPAYTRLDAALFYKLTDRIEAQLNVENLTDERYFPVAHNDNNISTGAPINARATLAVTF